MKTRMNLGKRICGALILPVAMYVVMLILCYANGKTYFGTAMMWRTLLVDIAVSVACAMGIGLQFKCGRFDFSGAAIMLVAAIVAGNVAKNHGNSIALFMVLCMGICVGLSLAVSFLYVYGRLPIIIATIGMALLYESVTCLMFNGGGINLSANMTLKVFSSLPAALIPLIGSIVVYAVYSYVAVTGKQAQLLANNQQAAVNIGINERKNVIISYLFSGIIFGFATMIYASDGIISASFTSLASVSTLFSYILPVFIGLMLMRFCGDTIGTILGAFTLCVLSYGLTAIFSSEMGAAITTVITGIFILLINVVSAQGESWIAAMKKLGTSAK